VKDEQRLSPLKAVYKIWYGKTPWMRIEEAESENYKKASNYYS